MANLPAQTHIADADCLDCGKEVSVKLNKNFKAYYFCNHVNVATGNYCGGHHRWGKDKSQEMMNDYLAARADHNKSERETHVQDQNTHSEIRKQPDPDAGAGDRDETGTDHFADRSRDNGTGGGWGLFDG